MNVPRTRADVPAASARSSPRAGVAAQRQFAPARHDSRLQGSTFARHANKTKLGDAGGAWTPTREHRPTPQLHENPLAEAAQLPGGGALQWSPGKRREIDRGEASRKPPPGGKGPYPSGQRRAVVRPPGWERDKEAKTVPERARHCGWALCQLVVLVGAVVMVAVSYVNGRSWEFPPEPEPEPPEPVSPIFVNSGASCAAAGCKDVRTAEECVEAALDLRCNVASWACPAGKEEECALSPQPHKREPQDRRTVQGNGPFVSGCSVSRELVQEEAGSSALRWTINWQEEPASTIWYDREEDVRLACSTPNTCVCDCSDLPDQWWCATQERPNVSTQHLFICTVCPAAPA